MSNTSYPTIKPKKITLILLSPFIAITMLCSLISAGIMWIVDRPWYEESMRQQRENNSSPTTIKEGEE
jgi:hypothetical protein